MSYQLRDYQQNAIDAIVAEWNAGNLNVMCAQATGLGKTWVGIGTLDQQMGPGDRALWLAHRDILVRQPMERMLQVWKPDELGIVKARQNETDKRVILGSVQTLCRENRMIDFLRDGPVQYLVTDEAHHSPAKVYRRIYKWLRDASPDLRHLGLTATPWRSDGAGMATTFDVMPEGAQKNIRWGIEHGYLVSPNGQQVETMVDIGGVSIFRGDFKIGQLEDVLEASEWHRLVVDAYEEHSSGKLAIAFTPGVLSSKRLAEEFNERGIPAAHVDALTPRDERRRVEKAFVSRELLVVSNVGIYGEGADFPAVETILMARPTQSHSLFTQLIGRGLRPFPGKAECLILLYKATGAKILTLFDLGESKELAEAKKKAEELGVEGLSSPIPLFDSGTINGVGVYARAVSLFGDDDYAWYREGATFSVGLGPSPKDGFERTLVILPPTNGVEVWRLLNIGRRGQWDTWKVYGNAIPSESVEDLMSQASETIHKWAAPVLSKKDRRWRKQPASAGQIRWLTKYIGGAARDLTKGDAAKLLTHYLAMDAIKRETET